MFTMPMRGMQVIHITESHANHFDVAPWVFGGQALFTVVIDSGVVIDSTDATLGGAIYSSVPVDPDRSRVIIRNSGTLLGCNGAGGNGGGFGLTVEDGGSGCSGISLSCAIQLYNLSGYIRAGGGGGGGGSVGNLGGGAISGGCGGGGYPGGLPGLGNTRSPVSGATSQYEIAAGGIAVDCPSGGDCNGPATAGSPGVNGGAAPGAGGDAGYGVNSSGNGVTVINGAANILGGTN